MANSFSVIGTSIGKKVSMALTGLFLCTFLVVHLVGNVALLSDDGGLAFNAYTDFMRSNMLIRIMEIGLLVGFLGHIAFGYMVSFQNKGARPKGYSNLSSQAANGWFARTMKWTGTLILIFLVIHLKSFWFEFGFGDPQVTQYGDTAYKDMYMIVKSAFSNWWYVLFYVVTMLFMAFHLNHGVQSGFRSLGLSDTKYRKILSSLGTVFAFVMGIGFALIPILMYVKHAA